MGYVIYNKDNAVVGKFFLDENKSYKECVFRCDNYSNVEDDLIFNLQLEGVSPYENTRDDLIVCFVGEYRVLVNFFDLNLIVKNELDEILRSYCVKKGYPKEQQ